MKNENATGLQAVAVAELHETGRALLRANDPAKAIVVANKCVELDGDNPESWALLGEAKFLWGDHEEGLGTYKKAIALRPDYAPYYYSLGTMYESLERAPEALLQFQRARHLDPSNNSYQAAEAAMLCDRAIAQHDLSALDENMAILEQCHQRGSSNEFVRADLAGAYLERARLGWVEDPQEKDAFYATEREHVEAAKNYLAKAESLNVADKIVAQRMQEMKKAVADSEKIIFRGRWRTGILAVLFGFGFVSSHFTIPRLLYLILSVLYFFARRQPQYIRNRKSFTGEKPSLLDRFMSPIYGVADNIVFLGSVTGVIQKMLFMKALVLFIREAAALLFLPIETLRGLWENYDLKKLITK